MTIGAPDNKQALDSVLHSTVVRLRDAFASVAQLEAKFSVRSDESLEALGYSGAEVDLARAAVLALDKLRDIAYAQDVQATPNNFFFDADKLTGWQ